MSALDDELRKVRARQNAAMADARAHGEDPVMAALRTSLDYAVDYLDPDLANLEAALGENVEAGSFFLGVQSVGILMQGSNVIEVAKRFGPLLREYMEKARQR